MKRFANILFWAIATAVAALPWLIFSSESSIKPVFLYPYHRSVLHAIIGLLLAIFLIGIAHGFIRGLKLIIVSSAFGFVVAMARGLWLSQSDGDCTSLCFGVLNRILGIGCGSAGEGCAVEVFLLVFSVTFFALVSKGFIYYLLRSSSHAAERPE